MPLFMDIHTVDSDLFSVEDVVKAHMQDLAVQERFGVKQLKYWVNVQAKTIFCLMEGPDKNACHQVHLQSHGNTACNIIEVADNEYNLFMGQGTDVEDLAITDTGAPDPGYRTLLLMNLFSFTGKGPDYIKQINQIILDHQGVIVRKPDHQTMATFLYAKDAISCASFIKNTLDDQPENSEFSLAVVSGKPVDEQGKSFFEETRRKVSGLCALGLNRKLYLDKETIALLGKELPRQHEKPNNFTVLDGDDLIFSMSLATIMNENFTRSDFTTVDLFKALGFSKSQANRKIKFLTGMAPNQLIQEYRLLQALHSMLQTNKTISETGYASGFNSPTYFTRVFRKRFGISPSSFSKRLE